MKTIPNTKFAIATIIASFTLTLLGAPLASAKQTKLNDMQLQERAAGAGEVNGLAAQAGERVGDLTIPPIAAPPFDVAGFVKEITDAVASNPGRGVFQSQSAVVQTIGPGVATVTQSQTLSR